MRLHYDRSRPGNRLIYGHLDRGNVVVKKRNVLMRLLRDGWMILLCSLAASLIGRGADAPLPLPTNDAPQISENCPVTTTGAKCFIQNSILSDPDPSWKAFGTPGLVVTTPGSMSAILGYVHNDLPAHTLALPAGINGYGKLAAGSVGNQVFGVYGLSELVAVAGTAIGGEFTVRNFAGTAETNLPPDERVGTAARSLVGLQVTAGGSYNSSIAVQIGPEGGSLVGFNTGLYLRQGSHAQYGIYVEPQASGTQISEYLGNNGSGTNLVMKTSRAMSPNKPVMEVLDAAGAGHFSVTQNGDIFGGGHFYSTGAMPSVSSCGASPAVTGHDHAGAITVGGGTVTACTLTFNSPYLRVPYCTTTPNSNVTLWVSAISALAFTVSSQTAINGQIIYYNCQG